MQKMVQNDAEMERLTDEIRRLGAPFANPEPDARYWTNFRVRVMDQISEREQRKSARWTTVAVGWVQEHILVASLSTAAVLFAVSLTLMLEPFTPSEPVAVAPRVALQAPPEASPPVVAENRTNPSDQSDQTDSPVQQPKASPIPEQPSMASLDLPAENPSDAIAPVSLDDLTAPELESVLNSLQTK
jgi:hypothetical protein